MADPSAEPAMAAASTIGSGPCSARASWQRLISVGLNCSIMPTTGSSAALSPAHCHKGRQGLPAYHTAVCKRDTEADLPVSRRIGDCLLWMSMHGKYKAAALEVVLVQAVHNSLTRQAASSSNGHAPPAPVS